MTAAGDSFLNDIVTLAGGVNIAGEWSGRYRYAALEWIVGQDPDVILAPGMGSGGNQRAEWRNRKGWSSIKAVRSGAICDDIPSDWLLRPGPRLILGAEALADWLMNL